ncbi:MerR family transcriptional regulator [Goodfellowiella coeruleoviolacea]|uniref:DNA-binding transcriptional regulator, MerR family n=1 Tax=Goodfellowiella coeruleoviolacea TaxID=334858 RepID=A0AAE3GLF6_9PSEU|nr:MerR family transcriptional regulator [Goodfellowiella coeruleoviolacea]MCP2170381.1 DNA-binding transcriptional regulator, MerR family [Goodfellowiella coeruleoviolacea]
MRIGELARRTGVSPRLLRYYEEQGLLAPERTANGYRSYSADAPLLVTQIRGLLSAGLPTEVIRDILPCARGAEPELEPCPDLMATLREELAGMDARIACLRQNRDALARYLDTAARRANAGNVA